LVGSASAVTSVFQCCTIAYHLCLLIRVITDVSSWEWSENGTSLKNFKSFVDCLALLE